MPGFGKMVMKDGQALLVERLYSGSNKHHFYFPQYDQDYLAMLAGGQIIAVGLRRETEGILLVGLTMADIAGLELEEKEGE